MAPKMFWMQVTRYSWRASVIPSKFLHARMTTSRGCFSSHSEISVSVSWAGHRRNSQGPTLTNVQASPWEPGVRYRLRGTGWSGTPNH